VFGNRFYTDTYFSCFE
jgi:hypothetical protein